MKLESGKSIKNFHILGILQIKEQWQKFGQRSQNKTELMGTLYKQSPP